MAQLPFINDPVARDVAAQSFDFFGIDGSLTDVAGGNNIPVPATRTRTSHGVLIRVAGGKVIGAVNGLAHTQDRELEEVYQVDVEGSAAYGPVDVVPQRLTGRSLSIKRYDLWTRPVEQAFGTGFEYTCLGDQRRPFTLQVIWRSPQNPLLGGRRIYEYSGCWFRRFGRTMSSTDNRIVNADAEIVYQRTRRLA